MPKPTTKAANDKPSKIDTKNMKVLESDSESDNEQPTKQQYTYERPEFTYQDRLTKDDVAHSLEDYEELPKSQIYQTKIGTHIRYFTKRDGVTKFRLGGTLDRVDDVNKFITLNNGKTKWSVQVGDVVQFYKKITLAELRQYYTDQIAGYKQQIKELRARVRELEK